MTKNLLPAIGAAGLGAGLMYMMDPDEGGRRRAMVRDKMVHLWHETEDMVEGQARNAANHVKGLAAETKGLFRKSGMSSMDDTDGMTDMGMSDMRMSDMPTMND